MDFDTLHDATTMANWRGNKKCSLKYVWNKDLVENLLRQLLANANTHTNSIRMKLADISSSQQQWQRKVEAVAYSCLEYSRCRGDERPYQTWVIIRRGPYTNYKCVGDQTMREIKYATALQTKCWNFSFFVAPYIFGWNVCISCMPYGVLCCRYTHCLLAFIYLLMYKINYKFFC